jgi:putative transposase
MSKLVTLAEIAAALGVSKSAAEKRAVRESWPYTEESVRGGLRRQYDSDTLPTRVRKAVKDHALKAAAATIGATLPAAPAPVAPPASLPAPLDPQTEEQRTRRDCREAVLRELARLQAEAGCSQETAMTTLLTNARARNCAPHIVKALQLARDRRGRRGPGHDGFPSVRSLKRWLGADDLTPRVRQQDMAAQPWHMLAIALSQRPQGSIRKWLHEQIVEQWDPAWGEAPPSYDAVCRFLREKASRIDPLVGRHTGSALKAHRFYRSRRTSHLEPFFEVHADGWATHFTAPHPVTGEFVTYEVWHFHCIRTRYVPPFSVGLSESFEVIAKGLENCIRVGGVPAILQTDSTGSVKNDRFEFDPVTSIGERAGLTVVHPQEVGNSQANGIPENFNTWLDRESRELATYQGAGMDSLSLKRVKKITAKMAKAATTDERARLRAEAMRMGKGLVFDSHAEALAWLEAKRQKWNDKPHSALAKLRDPQTGRLRHLSPNEALEAARAAGWEPVMLDEASLIDLFRPHVRKTVRRGCVSPFARQRYGAPELEHWNGEEVQVAFDIMDWRTVWVKDMQGRLIGEYPLVEAQGRAESFYEYVTEKRARAQVRRKENQITQIEERMAPAALEAPVAPAIDIAMQLYGDQVEAEPVALPQATPAARDARAVTPAATGGKRRHDDITDIAMYLYGDQLDEEGERERDDFEAAVG